MHQKSKNVGPLWHIQVCSSPSASRQKLLVPGAYRDSQSPEPLDDEFHDENEAHFHNDSGLRKSSCRPSKNPTTPTRTSVNPPRAPASDPGPRLRAQETLIHDRSPITETKLQAPCGKMYARVSACDRHQIGCRKCQIKLYGSPEKSAEQIIPMPDIADISGRQSSDAARPSNMNTEKDDKSRVEEEVHRTSEEPGQRPRKPDFAVSYDLHKKLKSGLKDRVSLKESDGLLYFLQVPQRPGIVKLGFTQDEFKRGKQHKQKCKLETIHANISIQFAKMKIAEKFMKIELDHLKAPWYCGECRIEHKEWFKVDIKQVDQLAERWRRWINDEFPYNELGTLKESWKWFIEHEMPREKDIKKFTHDFRWNHWNRILAHTSNAVDEQWRNSKQKHLSGEPPNRYDVSHSNAKSVAGLRYNNTVTVEIVVVLLLIWAFLNFSDMF
ncbi:unnamed protein product [Periconia digitata]|uniref:Bacteriophage T5 Orf172 DNA-binding domain-containing protein n=1 Tax=Periconia digitata TaxID=1303443 RepID=A0A9W4XSM9_9PLEO|nr:unnamed protein product [Periconia digitata]